MQIYIGKDTKENDTKLKIGEQADIISLGEDKIFPFLGPV